MPYSTKTTIDMYKDGYGIPGEADSTAGIQAAVDYLGSVGGGVLYLGPVLWNITHLTLRSGVTIVGIGGHHYWGYSVDVVPAISGLMYLPSGNETELILHPSGVHNAGLSSMAIVGANLTNGSADPVDGLRLEPTSLAQSFHIDDVGIYQFTGNGMVGSLFSCGLNHVLIAGCHGYGYLVEDPDRISVTNWLNPIFNGNKLGNIEIRSTSLANGANQFRGLSCWRAGWDEDLQSVAVGGTGADGFCVDGCLHHSLVDIYTDANSGHGVCLNMTSTSRIYDLRITGHLQRDGFGDMTTIGSYAGLYIRGIGPGQTIDNIDVSGLTISGGKARDNGTAPSYYHPQNGLDTLWTSFFQWTGGNIDGALVNPVVGGSAELDQTKFWQNLGALSIDGRATRFGPVWYAGNRPGQVGTSTAIQGMVGWNLDTGMYEVCVTSGKPGVWRVIPSIADGALVPNTQNSRATAPVTNATTSQVNIPDLTLTLTPGTYRFRYVIPNTVVGNINILPGLTGTATFSALDWTCRNDFSPNGGGVVSSTIQSFSAFATTTAGSLAGRQSGSNGLIEIEGSVVVTASGTIIPTFAASGATSATILRGSTGVAVQTA